MTTTSAAVRGKPSGTRAARMGRAIALQAAQQVPDSILGVGKWDRVMTPGAKVRDGVDFDFTDETLTQCVENFSKTHTARRMPLDYRHNAARDSDEPEQDLAYYDSMAVVWGGHVIKFWSQDPAVPPPGLTELLADIQTKFPRVTSADGLWERKCEVTPLGLLKLPNMHQLSPLFSKDDKAEDGTPIGYNLLNVSAVGVAFQDGTTINLSKRTTKMADNKIPENLMAKLAKHGLADDVSHDAVMSAMASYMSDTEDGPSDRKAMAACMAAMSDSDESLSKMDKDESEAKDDEDSTAEHKMSKKVRKDADVDPAVAKLVESLTSQNAKLSKRLDTFESKEAQRAEAEFYAAATQHTDRADAADYLKLCDNNAEKALKLIQKLPKRGVPMSRTFGGGSSDSKNAPVEASKVINNGMVVLHGHGLSTMAKKVAVERKISLKEAQRVVAREHPELLAPQVLS